ncbi:MAG: thiamine/thiamine pyrophosphate ABC transporter permease ThiP [Enterobacteriaceae bacterium]
MATGRQPVALSALWPGLLAAGSILGLALLTLSVLWLNSEGDPWSTAWHDSYLWHVIRFTFWQALLSTLFSVLPALFIARALFRRRFPGRNLLLRLCAMTLVLPVLVAIFGLIALYGKAGWLATLCSGLGLPYTFSPYGLHGIILAHLFFNLPLACRMLLQTLENIAPEQRQLAAQLGMSSWQLLRFVEWPALRRQLPSLAALIFMLCFASFATVLALGGGPKATTIEVAIYQALTWDFDTGRAALLAMIQLLCCCGLLVLCQRLGRPLAVGDTVNAGWRQSHRHWLSRYGDGLLILLLLLLVVPPLLAVLLGGINPDLPAALLRPALWQAVTTSLGIALVSALLAVTVTMMLLWSSRHLRLQQHPLAAQAISLSGLLILAMPAIVLATGLFLLLSTTIGIPQSPALIIIIINALMALPFALTLLTHPMEDLQLRYRPLLDSLGIRGWSRLYYIEFLALRRPLAQAAAFAAILSVGDFGAIALFGSNEFLTLPLYLYQQLGNYRSQQGAVTALLLLLLCFLLFTLLEKSAHRHDQAQ